MSESRGYVTDQLVAKIQNKAEGVDLATVSVQVHDFEGNKINGPALEGIGWTLAELDDSELAGVGPGQYILRATVPGVAGAQQQPFRNAARAEAVPDVAPRREAPAASFGSSPPPSDSVMAAVIQANTQMNLAMMKMMQDSSNRQFETMRDLFARKEPTRLDEMKEMAAFVKRHVPDGDDGEEGFGIADLGKLAAEFMSKIPAQQAPAPAPAPPTPTTRPVPLPVPSPVAPATAGPSGEPGSLDVALLPVAGFLRTLQRRESIDFDAAGAAMLNMLDAVCEDGQLDLLFAVEPADAAAYIVAAYPDLNPELVEAVCASAIAAMQGGDDDDEGDEGGAVLAKVGGDEKGGGDAAGD